MNKEENTGSESGENMKWDSDSYAIGLTIGLILGKVIFDNVALGIAWAPAIGYAIGYIRQKKK